MLGGRGRVTSQASGEAQPRRARAMGLLLAASLLPLAGCFDDRVGIGDEAPDFRLTDTDGQDVGPGVFRGSVLMLHIIDLSQLEAGNESLAKLVGIRDNVTSNAARFLSVVIADPNHPGTLEERQAEAARFKQQSGANWSFAAEDKAGRVNGLYEMQGVMAGYVIDRDGTIRGFVHTNFLAECVEETIRGLVDGRIPNESTFGMSC